VTAVYTRTPMVNQDAVHRWNSIDFGVTIGILLDIGNACN